MPLGPFLMCRNQQKILRDLFISACQMLRGFPGPSRSREMQTSKFRLGLKMRIECCFFRCGTLSCLQDCPHFGSWGISQRKSPALHTEQPARGGIKVSEWT